MSYKNWPKRFKKWIQDQDRPPVKYRDDSEYLRDLLAELREVKLYAVLIFMCLLTILIKLILPG